MTAIQQLEDIADEALQHMGVEATEATPIAVDNLLQTSIDEMWEKMDVTQLSGSFLSIKHRFSPRMSLARMMARQVVFSPWGKARNLIELIDNDEDLMRTFARMLIMPRMLIIQLDPEIRTNPAELEIIFQVPDDEAEKRIEEMA